MLKNKVFHLLTELTSAMATQLQDPTQERTENQSVGQTPPAGAACSYAGLDGT